jgi:hypothetical protein
MFICRVPENIILRPFVRYRRMDLTKFKTGDLVEAQVSFVGVPLKGGGTKMMT